MKPGTYKHSEEIRKHLAETTARANEKRRQARGVGPGERWCPKCQRSLATDKFSGRNGMCRPCQSRYATDWKRRNPEKAKLSELKTHLKGAYGLSLEEFQRMYASQEGKCAICGGRNTDRRLAVDHCHETGRVRGLLCTSCNLFLGHMERLPDVVAKMKAYLDAHRE